MKSWEAAYGAALELSQKTGVRHHVYKSCYPNNGWFISRLDTLEDAYRRVHKDVARRWKVYEEFRLVQHREIGWYNDDKLTYAR